MDANGVAALARAEREQRALAPLQPEPATHITIDARMVNHTGIGTYIRTVVPALIASQPDWDFALLGRPSDVEWMNASRRAELIACTAPIYSIQEQVQLVRRVPRHTSLLWVPHYNIPVLGRTPLLVTIHDLAHLRLPEYAGVARRAYARTLFHAVRRRAAAIMFVSDFSRREFGELVGTPRNRSATVPIGLGRDWLDPAPIGPAPVAGSYFVYVGSMKPHKNLGVLLEAFELVRGSLSAQLVIVGRTEGLRTTDEAMLRRLRAATGVSVVGEVNDERLRAYIAHATALVLPSRYEGFGLPPLEAMALGCPAIVADAASIPEVCGDAALYFRPSDSGALADGMRRVATDPALRASLVARGRARAERLTATHTATRVGDIVSQIVRR